MSDSFAKNFIDYEEYPVSADIQNRCVSMIGRLFHAPIHGEEGPVGTSCVGSSEAIMLAVLAMKMHHYLRQWGLDVANSDTFIMSTFPSP